MVRIMSDFFRNTSMSKLCAKKPNRIVILNVRPATFEEIAIACTISLMQGFYEKFIKDTMLFIDSDDKLSHKQKKKVKKYSMNTYTPLIVSEKIVSMCKMIISDISTVFYINEEAIENIFLVTDRFLKKHFSKYNSFGTLTGFFSTIFFEFKDSQKFRASFEVFKNLRDLEVLIAKSNIATIEDLVNEKKKIYNEHGLVFEDCLEEAFVTTELDRSVKLAERLMDIFKSEKSFIRYANNHKETMSEEEKNSMISLIIDTKSQMSEEELRKKYDA